MMYMRHEAGHAFNYAYELYKTDEWREIFGPFRRPYRDHYSFVPFSRNYVRHIAGWYAQKHPDEDFAETFAVWLTPRSKWREKYKDWPATEEAAYVDRICHDLGDKPPLRPLGETDFTVEDMEETIEEFYRETFARRVEGDRRSRARRRSRRHLQTSRRRSRRAAEKSGRIDHGTPPRHRRQGQLLDRRATIIGENIGGSHRKQGRRAESRRRFVE